MVDSDAWIGKVRQDLHDWRDSEDSRESRTPFGLPKKRRGETRAIIGWRAAENLPGKKKRNAVAQKQTLTLRLNYENYGKPDRFKYRLHNHENSLDPRIAGRCHLPLFPGFGRADSSRGDRRRTTQPNSGGTRRDHRSRSIVI